jgi:hypothetical protein
MADLCSYRIEVLGRASEPELNRASPVRISVEETGGTGMRLWVQADQSALIGLMRHLHTRGFVFLMVMRQEMDRGRSAP